MPEATLDTSTIARMNPGGTWAGIEVLGVANSHQ